METRRIPCGCRVQIIGWLMLAKLADGTCYTIRYGSHCGLPTYVFCRGQKRIVAHYASDVDLWLHNTDPRGDHNSIVVLAPSA